MSAYTGYSPASKTLQKITTFVNDALPPGSFPSEVGGGSPAPAGFTAPVTRASVGGFGSSGFVTSSRSVAQPYVQEVVGLRPTVRVTPPRPIFGNTTYF